MATNSLSSTYHGYIESTIDALLVIEASIQGALKPIFRRPRGEHERESLVTSGCVIVFDDQSSGIKRWTDGKSWSPSRLEKGFLIYREVEGDCRHRGENRVRKSNLTAAAAARKCKPTTLPGNANSHCLIKKAMGGVKLESTSYSLISYYTAEDISKLTTPSNDLQFQNIHPRSTLTSAQYTPRTNSTTPRPPKPRPSPLTTSSSWSTYYGRNGNSRFTSNYQHYSPSAYSPMGGYYWSPSHNTSGIFPGPNRAGQYVIQPGPWLTEGSQSRERFCGGHEYYPKRV